jgi:hypothetical protein
MSRRNATSVSHLSAPVTIYRTFEVIPMIEYITIKFSELSQPDCALRWADFNPSRVV